MKKFIILSLIILLMIMQATMFFLGIRILIQGKIFDGLSNVIINPILFHINIQNLKRWNDTYL